MRRSKRKRTVKPLMARFFRSLSSGSITDTEVHMFAEDIHLGIMPIGGRTVSQEDFNVVLSGNREECKKAKEVIAELAEYEKYDISAIVCDAVTNIAKHLSWEGEVFFEIIKDDGKVYLDSFTSKNLFSLFNFYLQITPSADMDMWRRRLSYVQKKYVWKVEIPLNLGGKRDYMRTLEKLQRYDHLGPVFYRNDIEKGKQTESFNLLEYTRNSEIYFNRVTRLWGWNRRDWGQKNNTEYYTFYKFVGFNYAKAILREHIINEMNKLLARLSIECEIIVSGIPTAKEILKIKSDMQQGEISFTEVSDKLRLL